jgi:subfamily B ATP-binding cassette protein HlyB/CyaB
MPRRLLKLVSKNLLRKPQAHAPGHTFSTEDIIWAMGSFCALNRKPFDAGLLIKQFPLPYSSDSLVHAARALGFRIKRRDCDSKELSKFNLPCLVILIENAPAESFDIKLPVAHDIQHEEVASEVTPIESTPSKHHPAIVVKIEQGNITLFEADSNQPKTMTQAEFTARFAGTAFQLALETKSIKDPDGALKSHAQFGFRWFIPELLKHKRIWRDVLIASLIIQLLALGTPLFTQVIIDKVVVHHTQSTLIVIGLAVFMIFSALLSWVRQYLILHTGNRVDAVLGAAVFDHLFKLPPRYFEHRPTGVIAARLHGVETIRDSSPAPPSR